MPEIEFKIDTEAGTCETEIKGYQGPVCEKTARQLKKILGNPSKDEKTREYHIKLQAKGQIKST